MGWLKSITSHMVRDYSHRFKVLYAIKNNKKIHFNSVKEASYKLSIGSSCISSCLT